MIDSLKLSVKVTYVEQSVKMIELAKTMAPFQTLEIDFIEGNEDSIPENQYDVLFTAFFLDVFKEDHCQENSNQRQDKQKNNLL